MKKSDVFFTDMHATPEKNIQKKLKTLILKAGLDTIDFKDKFVAIKIHFGEPGNLSYLRPNFAKTVADTIKELGGRPFLTDCNTLYVGRRKNALDHIDAAYENGYSPFSTGCQVIIADGLKGTDDVEVPVNGGEYIQNAHIGRAIMDADIYISLNHFKGHESTGFGGAIKNTGMGCGSRAGKMDMHCSGKPDVSARRCRSCGMCMKNCAHGAISFNDEKKATIDHNKCVGCGRCIGACNFDAIYNKNNSANDELNRKMAEYAKAVVDGRPSFHINIVNQVSPYCDCHAENDIPIVPDVGMFASFDPVAIDVACADACNKMPVMEGSLLAKHMRSKGAVDYKDHFTNTSPDTNWRSCMEHGEKIGLGSCDYNLITVN